MDVEEKLKELTELFTKANNELNQIVKRNENFIADEVRRVQEAIERTSKVCWEEQKGRVQNVKGTYDNRIKMCNDKAAAGFRNAKIKYDQEIQRTENLSITMKQILRDCFETNEFVKCVADRTKEVVNRRKQITENLSETVKNAELSAGEQLKEATKCHADAQMEALESLQRILKDTKDCLLRTR